MAVPAKLVIYAKDSKPLSGPVPVKDIEINDLSGSEIQAFLHRVYSEKVRDRLYAIAYHTDFIRKHDPLIITKPIDKLTMSICSYLKNETFLPKIEIRWYKYNEKSKNLEEYFRTTLENARITSQRITLPDVKDKAFEKYDQTEEVTFAYQRITWLYHKGYLLFADEWNECYDELYLKDFSGKEEDPFAYLESMPELEPLKVKFTKAELVEPQNGFQIDKNVKAKYDSESSREPTMKESKVFAKLYARYKGQTEDLRQIQEGWIRKDGTWSTDFLLEKPRIYEKGKDKKDDAVIEYFTEIENRYAGGNFRSEFISVPVKKLKLEIKDMEGPKELVHNRSGTYTVKFNRKASDNEKSKVSWVVRINGKETDRFENVGETLEFTPIGKYAGETVTVHPFLRSPSDELCVETTVGECLVFNGSELIWLDEKHKEKGKWRAVSASSDNSDPEIENGPVPEGRWVVLQTKREIAENDSWWENLINRKSANESSSNERLGLIPFSTTDTYQRDEEFYIHGSKEADIVPGINLGRDIDSFIDSFVNSGKNLVLVAKEFLKILNMSTSENGIKLIMKYEGFMSNPYNCSAGHATIGYGTLLHMGPVNKEDLKKYSSGITKENAKEMLEKSIIIFEKALNDAVEVILNQNQFDALMSWTYNLGVGNLNESKCTWLKELNNGNYDKVPENLIKWNKIRKNGELIELPGLTKRRKEEAELFIKKGK